MTKNIWLCGPFGKMGTALRSAISVEDDINITGVVSPGHVGENINSVDGEFELCASLEELSNKCESPDVIVDFTKASAAYENAIYAGKNSIDFISGTTGLSEQQRQEIVQEFEASGAKAIIASNFSVGAVLMMRFAAQAAAHFSHSEIVEIHHAQKLDAPSGTAITTKEKMIENANQELSEIPIHSLRLPGAIAHQQVYFSNLGEVLRIEHDANDRRCFMPGIILSIREIDALQGVSFSIEKLLFPN